MMWMMFGGRCWAAQTGANDQSATTSAAIRVVLIFMRSPSRAAAGFGADVAEQETLHRAVQLRERHDADLLITQRSFQQDRRHVRLQHVEHLVHVGHERELEVLERAERADGAPEDRAVAALEDVVDLD